MYQKFEAYEIRLGNLLKIDQAILENKSLDEIAEIAIHGIVELFPGAWVSILKVDELLDEATILAVESSREHPGWTHGNVISVKTIGELAKLADGQVLSVENVSTFPFQPPLDKFLETEKVTSYIVIPLVSQANLLGTLHLGIKGNAGGFDTNEIEMLMGFGAQLAISMAQSELNAEKQAHRARLETLLEVSTALSRSLNLNEVMQLTIDEATRVLKLETGALYLLDENVMYLGATTPPLPPDFPDEYRTITLVQHPHIQQALESSSPIYLPDTLKADLTPEEHGVSVERGLRSLLYVPLILDDKATGVLIMGTVGRTREFSQDEIDLCCTFSAQMALAVENARLHHKVSLHAQELEERVRDRTAELEALSYSISHDLRGPLRSIRGYGQILETDFGSTFSEEAKDYLERMIASSQRLEAMLDGLLRLRELGSRPFHPEELNFFEIVKQINADVSRLEPDRAIEIELGECSGLCTSFLADQSYIEILLTNLLSNAIKFTKTREVAKIKFGCFDEDGQGVFFVRDNGVGFDQKYADEMFLPFRSLHSRDIYPGFGIGMTVVKKIIELHRGRIWVESQTDVGTTVYFTLEPFDR